MILVSNISFKRVTIPKSIVIADDKELKTRRVDTQDSSASINCVAIVSTTDAGSAPSADFVCDALKNADGTCLKSGYYLNACFASTL